MRALCASIISAGALIGLGLTALGVGTRYQGLPVTVNGSVVSYIHWRELDTPMMLILVLLICTLIAALAATFMGLAYHHERRHFERHGHLSGSGKVDSLRN
jgi:cytochrome bd-type quinol oxidase subunit 2